VDDEASIREITKETLESYGYRTLVAGDGAEAIALFAGAKKDVCVVLTDMRMPFMDGMATIRALRKLAPTIKVIATSGLDQDGAEASAGAGVIEAFLHKPYTAEKLLTTLKEILG
jgi:CheY-like chemotaxis protein